MHCKIPRALKSMVSLNFNEAHWASAEPWPTWRGPQWCIVVRRLLVTNTVRRPDTLHIDLMIFRTYIFLLDQPSWRPYLSQEKPNQLVSSPPANPLSYPTTHRCSVWNISFVHAASLLSSSKNFWQLARFTSALYRLLQHVSELPWMLQSEFGLELAVHQTPSRPITLAGTGCWVHAQ